MGYQDILNANPGLRQEGDKISTAIKVVADAFRDGYSTADLIVVVGEIGKLALTSFPIMQALPEEQRVVVLGEAFDGCVGEEETAILKKIGFLGEGPVEKITDAIKIGAGEFWLTQIKEVA